MDAPAVIEPPALPVPAEPFPDGIYFGLPEENYHADPALGSTAIKTLVGDPTAWWYGSALNPTPPVGEEKEKAHLVVGSAVHKLVLEGAQAFHALYARAPDGDDLLRTSDHLEAWLKAATAKHAEAMKAISLSPAIAKTKPARISQIRDLCDLIGIEFPRIADVIEADAFMAGVTLLKPDDFDRIVAAGGAISSNPHLGPAFRGGMPEVSVFWTDEVDGEPVRRKVRIDYLKPRACCDLKSSRPRDGMDFVASCRRALADFNYPAQAAGYMQGRLHIPRLIAEGRVFGEVDPAWLKKLADAASFGWVFVFWSNADAVQTWGGTISLGSDLLAVGEEYVRRGLENFVKFRRFYGVDHPWIEQHPLEEIELAHLPGWYGKN